LEALFYFFEISKLSDFTGPLRADTLAPRLQGPATQEPSLLLAWPCLTSWWVGLTCASDRVMSGVRLAKPCFSARRRLKVRGCLLLLLGACVWPQVRVLSPWVTKFRVFCSLLSRGASKSLDRRDSLTWNLQSQIQLLVPETSLVLSDQW